MIEIGQYNNLRVDHLVSFGAYLDDGDGSEQILLPLRYVPEGLKENDYIKVFIYHDNEGRIIATTAEPYAVVGEVASLRVREVTDVGAFLDWGIMKDLLVPFKEQSLEMMAGYNYCVYLYIDEMTMRIAASARLRRYINNENLTVKQGEEVKLIVVQKTDLGLKVVVNNRHFGVLYHNEIFRPLKVGDRAIGYIKTIREDNKLDVSLQKQGFEQAQDAATIILNRLTKAGGFLALHDGSTPEQIQFELHISKKTFKKAVGTLYKQRKITLEPNGIRLIG